jgi:hypothetical protein
MSHVMRAVFCAALVFRLLVDVATPFMPGAFRFDGEESIDGVRTHPVRPALPPAARPSGEPPVIVETRSTGAAERIVPASDDRVVRFRPRLVRHPEPTAETVEDH